MSDLFPEVRRESVSTRIIERLRRDGVPFAANDNIASHISPDELALLEEEVEEKFAGVLRSLIIDTATDPNTQGTAKRVAKLYCREVFRGRYEEPPKLTAFPNTKRLDELYLTGPISLRSCCSHHFCPIIGKVWVGVIPGEQVIGLSKFNRLVDWVCSRPQIQEEMAVQIADELEKAIAGSKGIAVVVEATHTCMTWRGVREGAAAVMTNSIMRGAFRDKPEARAEFMALLKRD